MTIKKSGPNKQSSQSRTPAGPKKPYATLDLKATELKSATSAQAARDETETSIAGATPQTPSSSRTSTTPSSDAKGVGDTKTGAGSTRRAGSSVPDSNTSKATDKTASSNFETQKSAHSKSSSGSGRFITHMAAGIVGATLALFGGAAIAPHLSKLGLPIFGSFSGASNETSAKVEERLAALESYRDANATKTGIETIEAQVNAAEAKLAEVDSLSNTLSSIQAQVGGIEAELAAARDSDTAIDPAVTEARIEALEQQLSTLEAAAGQDEGGNGIANLAAITGRLSDLETTLTNQMAALRKSVGADIETRIAKIAEASETAKAGSARVDRKLSTVLTDSTRTAQRLEVIKADLDRVSNTVRLAMEETAGIKSSLGAHRGDVSRTIASLASQSDLKEAVEDVSSRVEILRENVGNVVKAEQDRKKNAQRIVLSLELGNLKRAVERGDPYKNELAEVRKAGAGHIDLETLGSFASTGVETIPVLQKSFRPVANSILNAADQSTDGSVIDQFMAGARSLVRVRKVNHSPDDQSVEAIVGRMEKAIEDGQLDQAAAAADALPIEVREPAEDWVGKVNARRAVDTALSDIDAQLKASLSGTDTPSGARLDTTTDN